MNDTTAAPAEAKSDTQLIPAQESKAVAKSTPIEVGEGGVNVKTSGELMALARIMAHGNKLVPKQATEYETQQIVYGVAVMIQAGYEVGLSPVMAQRAIYPVNGRPAWMVEGALAVCKSKGAIDPRDEDAVRGPEWIDMPPPGTQLKDWPNTAGCRVGVKRVGWKQHKFETFTVGDAKLLGKWGESGPWSKRPKRMLYARPMSDLLRDNFSDVLLGLPFKEETEDMERDAARITSAPAKLEPKPQASVAFTAPLDEVEAEIVPAAEPGQAPVEFDEASALSALKAECSKRTAGDAAAAADLLREVRGDGELNEETFDAAMAACREHPVFGDGPEESFLTPPKEAPKKGGKR
jgi:hypothetical protein